MPDTPLYKKLGIKPGYSVLVLGAPEGYAERLGELPEGVNLLDKAPREGRVDVVHAFVRDAAELRKVAPEAIDALKPGGLLWFSYPKKSSKLNTDLDRDSSWAPLTDAGLRIVTAISVDDTWTGLRFRPVSDVKSSRKS